MSAATQTSRFWFLRRAGPTLCLSDLIWVFWVHFDADLRHTGGPGAARPGNNRAEPSRARLLLADDTPRSFISCTDTCGRAETVWGVTVETSESSLSQYGPPDPLLHVSLQGHIHLLGGTGPSLCCWAPGDPPTQSLVSYVAAVALQNRNFDLQQLADSRLVLVFKGFYTLTLFSCVCSLIPFCRFWLNCVWCQTLHVFLSTNWLYYDGPSLMCCHKYIRILSDSCCLMVAVTRSSTSQNYLNSFVRLCLNFKWCV